MAVCAECGADVAPDSPLPSSCPSCGGTSHCFSPTLAAAVRPQGSMIAHARPDLHDEAVRTSGPPGGVSGAFDQSGAFAIQGRPPQGEQGALEAARLLVAKLNSLGESWGEPILVEDGDVDCRATDGQRTLEIQITRVAPESVWRSLARDGGTEGAATADDILAGIRRKAERYASPAQRARLTLAIDATTDVSHALRGVLYELPREAVAGFGFAAVWVIGPTIELVRRIDKA